MLTSYNIKNLYQDQSYPERKRERESATPYQDRHIQFGINMSHVLSLKLLKIENSIIQSTFFKIIRFDSQEKLSRSRVHYSHTSRQTQRKGRGVRERERGREREGEKAAPFFSRHLTDAK